MSLSEVDYTNCRLCPRCCGVNREAGQKGRCRTDSRIFAARAALHMWEEPCISGEEGSGAVFFSGCSLGCVFCQNREIALADAGKEISPEKLSEIFLELQDKKANNINLVTAAHFLPSVSQALIRAKDQGLKIPVLYNSSGYEMPDILKQMEGLIDIYLPDFKYMDPRLGEKYSACPDYPDRAKEALAEMVRQQPDPVFDLRGMMTAGVVVRHLLLPGCGKDSRAVIRYLYETYKNHIFISIMNQYTPMPGIEEKYPELARRVTHREYDRVVDYAIDLGVENGFIQSGDTAKDSFIPAFDYEGI